MGPRRLTALGPRIAAWGPLAGLGAITAILAWCYLGVFDGEPCGDDNTFHLAELARLARAFAAGDLDLWNPLGNGGFASGYYYQVVPQAAPALLSAATGLAPLTCFQLGIFVPLVLAPAAAYRAMRVLGASPWVALGAAVAVPFAIGVSRWGHGADGTFTVGLYTQLWAFVALPLAVAHGARWIDAGTNLPAAIAWGLFVGLCHPFAGIALGVALVAGTPWAWWRTPMPWWPVPARLGVLGALLVLGSACAWLPVLVDHDGFGGFPHRVRDEVGPGFVQLGAWLVRGQVLDDGRLPVLTALLPAVIVLGRAAWMPRLGAAALAYALLLGVGPNLPRVGSDDLLPAVRFWGPLQIVLAMIAGGGAAWLVERAWAVRLDDWWRPVVRSAATTIAAIAAVFAVGLGAEQQRARVRSADDYAHIARRDLDGIFAALATAPPGRLQIRAGAENHWAILLPDVYAGRPASLVMGGAALQSSPNYAYLWQLRDRQPARAAWVFDAPLVLARTARVPELAGATHVKMSGEYSLVALPSPGLVGPVHVVGTLPAGREAARRAGVGWLWSPLPAANHVLAHDGHGGAGPPPAGEVRAVRRGASTITAELVATAPTTFVVRESWHPRWHATLDGAAARVRRVTPDFMAVDVPAGSHALRLTFDRPVWTWLLWLLAPLLPLAAWATFTARARRRP